MEFPLNRIFRSGKRDRPCTISHTCAYCGLRRGVEPIKFQAATSFESLESDSVVSDQSRPVRPQRLSHLFARTSPWNAEEAERLETRRQQLLHTYRIECATDILDLLNHQREFPVTSMNWRNRDIFPSANFSSWVRSWPADFGLVARSPTETYIQLHRK